MSRMHANEMRECVHGDLVEHVQNIVDEFCDERITEDRIRQWRISRGVPEAEYRAFYESELGKYCLPPMAGGFDGPFIARAALVARLMRRAGATMPYLTDMTSMALLSTMRILSQQEIAEDLMSCNGRVAFSQAFSEGGQGESGSVTTEVTVDEGGIFLDGVKTFVANGQYIPRTLVYTRDMVNGTADGGVSLWLVPIDEPGVSTFPLNTVGQEMLAPARIEFEHVKLNPDWQIQTEGKLSQMLERQYELGRILICASSLGLAQAAMDDVLERCATHVSHGRNLGGIPQIQQKVADMAVRVRAMDMLVTRAAESISNGADADQQHLDCALMKYYVPKAATEVASEALQIFGGVGYTDDARVGRIWRDCRGNQIAQGTDEIMPHTVAKTLIKNCASRLVDF